MAKRRMVLGAVGTLTPTRPAPRQRRYWLRPRLAQTGGVTLARPKNANIPRLRRLSPMQ